MPKTKPKSHLHPELELFAVQNILHDDPICRGLCNDIPALKTQLEADEKELQDLLGVKEIPQQCPNCGKPHSPRATKCPECGYSPPHFVL